MAGACRHTRRVTRPSGIQCLPRLLRIWAHLSQFPCSAPTSDCRRLQGSVGNLVQQLQGAQPAPGSLLSTDRCSLGHRMLAINRPVALAHANAPAQRPLLRHGLVTVAAPARRVLCHTSSSAAAVPGPDEPAAQPPAAEPAAAAEPQAGGFRGWLRAQQLKSAEGRTKLAALGLAAVLAYGELKGGRAPAAICSVQLGSWARQRIECLPGSAVPAPAPPLHPQPV